MLFQEQVTAAISLAMEQQMQKLLVETQLDMNEFDNLLQPIIDTCTKDAISVWAGNLPRSRPLRLICLRLVHCLVISGSQAVTNVMFSNAKNPAWHARLMASHLRNPSLRTGGHFELRPASHLSDHYILHHWWAQSFHSFIRNCLCTL